MWKVCEYLRNDRSNKKDGTSAKGILLKKFSWLCLNQTALIAQCTVDHNGTVKVVDKGFFFSTQRNNFILPIVNMNTGHHFLFYMESYYPIPVIL